MKKEKFFTVEMLGIIENDSTGRTFDTDQQYPPEPGTIHAIHSVVGPNPINRFTIPDCIICKKGPTGKESVKDFLAIEFCLNAMLAPDTPFTIVHKKCVVDNKAYRNIWEQTKRLERVRKNGKVQ